VPAPGEISTDIIGSVERVLEAGPIPYRCIVLRGDPDLEHGLRHYGVEPETTSYRLIELLVPSITDTRSMRDRVWDRSFADAVLAGVPTS
jgi:hypothetical protein